MRDAPRVGEAIAAATDAGANLLSGPDLRISNREQASRSAYAAAYRAARERAEAYAGAAGLKITRVLAIYDNGEFSPPAPYARAGGYNVAVEQAMAAPAAPAASAAAPAPAPKPEPSGVLLLGHVRHALQPRHKHDGGPGSGRFCVEISATRALRFGGEMRSMGECRAIPISAPTAITPTIASVRWSCSSTWCSSSRSPSCRTICSRTTA